MHGPIWTTETDATALEKGPINGAEVNALSDASAVK